MKSVNSLINGNQKGFCSMINLTCRKLFTVSKITVYVECDATIVSIHKVMI